MTLKVGDEIRVEFTGKITRLKDDDRLADCYIVTSNSTGLEHMVYTGADQSVYGDGFDFRCTAPDLWPPQPGDLWRTEKGGLSFLGAAGRDEKILAVELRTSDPHTSLSAPPDRILEKYPDLRLVYRNL